MFWRPHNLLNLVTIRFLGVWGLKFTEGQLEGPKEKENSVAEPLPTKSKIWKWRSSEHPQETTTAIETSSKNITQVQVRFGIPGLVVGVSKGGSKLWEESFGLCDVENQLPCDPGARMRVASISKALFAATVVGPMIEENKIDLDAPIHKYLSTGEFPRPNYKGKSYDITTRQLLSHTAGIAHYPECDGEDLLYLPIGSKDSLKVFQCDCQYKQKAFFQRKHFRNVQDSLQLFKDNQLAEEPGKFYYSTNGYVLLSAVVEKAHQLDEKNKNKQIEDHWIEVMRKLWNMKETVLDQDETFIPKRARYYLRTSRNGAIVNAPYTDNSSKWAGGGISSSTSDLLKFGNALIDSYKGREKPVLKRETVDLLWKRVTSNYGLGFYVDKFKLKGDVEEFVAYHTGGGVGASSVLLIFPESEIVVAIIANLGSIGLTQLGVSIAREFSMT